MEQKLQRESQERIGIFQDGSTGKHKERSMLKDVLQQLQKESEEEEEARVLIEEMQRNLNEAQAKAPETERKLGRVLGEYAYSYEKQMVRPHYITDKMWQMMP